MTMTSAQFSTKIAAVKRSTTTLRENIQTLIEDGLAHAQENGNTFRLTEVLNTCIGTKSLPTQAIKEYIKEHATNLKWGKNKDGNFVFSKEKKGEDYGITMPTTPWWEATGKAQATSDLDITSRVKGLLTSIEKAMAEGKIKQGQEEKAGELREMLARFTA